MDMIDAIENYKEVEDVVIRMNEIIVNLADQSSSLVSNEYEIDEIKEVLQVEYEKLDEDDKFYHLFFIGERHALSF